MEVKSTCIVTMVLPPIERTPLIVLRFTKKASVRLIDLVIERFHQGGLVVISSPTPSSIIQDGSNERLLLYITTSQAAAEAQAERIHLMKLTNDTNTIEYFTVKSRMRFCHVQNNNNNSSNQQVSTAWFSPTMQEWKKWWKQQQQSSHKFRNNQHPNYINNNKDQFGLFTANEWMLLVFRILDEIAVLPDGINQSTELSQILDEQYRADLFTHNETSTNYQNNGHPRRGSAINNSNQQQQQTGTSDLRASFIRRHSISSASMSSRSKIREHGEQSSVCLWHILQTYDIVDNVIPVHIPELRQHILDELFRWPFSINPISDQLVTEIQEYYGWEISFYFAWMGFVTRWSLFPGILGVGIFLLRWYRKDNVETDEYTPFYGLITFIWSILFLKFWERNEHRLAYKWGTYSLSSYEKQKYFAVRPEFYGFLRVSPVTGLVETYYPPIRRRIKYLVSAIVTIIMLTIAFIVMCLSLNLQGYINPKTDRTRWNDNNPHPFHVRVLAQLAEEGQLFDAKSMWRCYIPVVLHVTCIFMLNYIYRHVALVLTKWENHETQADFRNSLILKRFLFEAFDCYVALFYLAFYERDVDRLQLELIAVFQIDTLRRMFLECLIPMFIQRFMHQLHAVTAPPQNLPTKQQAESGQKIMKPATAFSEKSTTIMTPTTESILLDLENDEYEQFDDYMEIVIQLGYVTLFASAYPLASIISIVANWIEIRSDCTKLAKVCRRPRPYRSSGLGVWNDLISIVLWTSALTNCLIAGFTSGQLHYFLPEFYDIHHDVATNDIRTTIDKENGWLVVFLIFGLERLLLIAGLLIHTIVPSVPEDVADELERRQYVRFLEQLDVGESRMAGKSVEDKKTD